MIIYIDRSAVPDVENIENAVFKYLLKKALPRAKHYDDLYSAYLGKNRRDSLNKEEVKVNINYVKYVVDIVRAFYLGEPVKYDNNDEIENSESLSNGTQVAVRNGKIVKHEWDRVRERAIDIRPVLDAYEKQIISKADSKIGKYISLFGEAQELIYASDSDVPQPKSYVYKPQECILVQDNTVEHRNLFFMTFEKRERVQNEQPYWAVTVYTPNTQRYYESTDLETFYFTAFEPKEIYFGAVPCINYENDDERQGDIEQLVELSNVYSDLMSDRLTDKKKFVDSLLAVFGTQIAEDTESGKSTRERLKDSKILDGLPMDARVEYIQKVFDEASVKVLCDDLLREIHKMSMTVDMSDESFSGNVTGVALNMKFLPMKFLAKNKIRSMDEGLKQRFELYNAWLNVNCGMPIIPTSEIDVVFTVDMPSNLSEMVDIVQKLEGRVDEKTLLSLLPFVKDPDEMAKLMEEKRQENKKQFLDSFSKDENEQVPHETPGDDK